MQNSETSGPSRYSSTTTRPHAAACASATSRSSVTTTPLPAARPSSLTTYGGPKASRAFAASSAVSQMWAMAVGTLAAAITCLANALEPSSSAASADGPKQAMPRARTASAAPATSGASGPITTRSTPMDAASSAIASGLAASTGVLVATCAVPALPGAQYSAPTSSSRLRARHRACSRAPAPTTRTSTRATLPTPERRRPVSPGSARRCRRRPRPGSPGLPWPRSPRRCTAARRAAGCSW